MPASKIALDPTGRGRRERGSVLIIVLWFAVLLAVMATGFSVSMRQGSKATLNMVESLRAEALADAAIQRGINDLFRPVDQRKFIPDGTQVTFQFGGGDLTLAIQNEHGKIDINVAPEALLKGLFLSVGVTDEKAAALTDAILDWRDADNFRHLRGAEDAEYVAAGKKFFPTNGPFRTISELQQVLGMDRETYGNIMPLVTVYSLSPEINILLAPRGVLAAIPGVQESEIDTIMAAREENRYNQSNTIVPVLAGVAGWVSLKRSPVYTVTGSAKLSSGSRYTRDVVVWLPKLGEQRYWILDRRTRSTAEATPDAKE